MDAYNEKRSAGQRTARCERQSAIRKQGKKFELLLLRFYSSCVFVLF